MAEKSINIDVIDVDSMNLPEDLLDLNPYHSVPTLIDRDLVLYDSRVIIEYLDERFPHPPLMPVDPVARASNRLYRYRIRRDIFSLVTVIETGNAAAADTARKSLRDHLTAVAPIFAQKPHFMSDDYSLADCYLAPLLWRLPHYKISLPRQAKPVMEYAERLFEREAFEASLSDAEREMGER